METGYGYVYSRHKTADKRYFCVITDYSKPKTRIVTEEELLNAGGNSTELFMKKLRAIPSRKQDNHYKKLKKISSGAAYLYKTVILPKMRGKEVYTRKVNMAAFDLEDIETVCDYYNENVAADRPENKPLFELYSKIADTPPLNSHSDFI